MKRLGFVLLALCFSAASVRAEEQPRFEVFGGYSYGQLNPGGRLVAGSNPDGNHFGLSGWHGAGQANLLKGVGLVADFSGYAGTSDIDLVAEHQRYYSFLAGPQLNFRQFGSLNILAHGLVGVAKDRVFLKTGALLTTTNSRALPERSAEVSMLLRPSTSPFALLRPTTF